MTDDIKVAIKVRRLIKKEIENRLKIQWVVNGNTIAELDPKTGQYGDTKYQFDDIFDMGRSNLEIFNNTAKPIVEAAVRGFNGTIFAYGQTGSGKTYTMMGPKDEPGVIPLAVRNIFELIDNDSQRVYLLRVSYVEILNEKINDLLDQKKKNIKLREDGQGILIIECKEEIMNSPNTILKAIIRGDKERSIGNTNMNEKSNRSHTIFRITIESCEKSNPNGTMKISQLNLVDLAGSERVHQTGATGETFLQGKYINKSLSTLSLVIRQLSGKNKQHVNFRDSKLTRILQASLGGNTLTTIICAVSPTSLKETKRTLAFAHRAKGIKNDPHVNEIVPEKAMLKQVLKQVEILTSKIQEMESKRQEDEKSRELLQARIELMNNKVISRISGKNSSNTRSDRRNTWGGFDGNLVPASTRNVNFDLGIIETEFGNPRKKITEEEYLRLVQSYIRQSNATDASEYADIELQIIDDEKNRLSKQLMAITDDDKIANQVPSTSEACEILPECIDLCSPDKTSRKKEALCRFSEMIIETMDYNVQMVLLLKTLKDRDEKCHNLNKKISDLENEVSILIAKNKRMESEKNELMYKFIRVCNNIETEGKNEIQVIKQEAEMQERGLENEYQRICQEKEDITLKLHEEREKNFQMAKKNKELTDEIKDLHGLMDEMVKKIENQKNEGASSSCKTKDFTEHTKKLRLDDQKMKSKENFLNKNNTIHHCEIMGKTITNLEQTLELRNAEIRCLQSQNTAYETNLNNTFRRDRHSFLSPILEKND